MVKYGDWLKYVMRAEGVKEETLVKGSRLSAARLEELMAAKAEPTRMEIDAIAKALDIPLGNMEKSLKAMQTYDRIADFKDECAGACCPWNAPVD